MIRPSGLRGRWLVDPATGAVIVATLPTLIALISLGPALVAALFGVAVAGGWWVGVLAWAAARAAWLVMALGATGRTRAA